MKQHETTWNNNYSYKPIVEIMHQNASKEWVREREIERERDRGRLPIKTFGTSYLCDSVCVRVSECVSVQRCWRAEVLRYRRGPETLESAIDIRDWFLRSFPSGCLTSRQWQSRHSSKQVALWPYTIIYTLTYIHTFIYTYDNTHIVTYIHIIYVIYKYN